MALLTSHSVEAYSMGGGILYLAPWDGATPPEEADYFDAGNMSSFSYSVSSVTVEHENTRGQTMTIDKRTVTKTGCNFKFVLDEFTIKNISIHAMGEISDHTIHGAQAADQEWAVRFVTDNASGENQIFNCWRCSLTPDGDVPWISLDKFKVLGFAGAALDDTTNHSTSPLFDITVVEATV